MSPFQIKHFVLCASALVVLTAGGCLRDVPDVVGMQESEAVGMVGSAGFTVGTVEREVSATVPAGRVISQDPAGGGQLEEGSPIDLVVSLGPEPVELDMPAVTGLSRFDAETALVEAGLVVGNVTHEYSESVPYGLVISQDPAAGTAVAAGTHVDLVVSRGGEPTAVPNLIGMTRAAAESALTGAGLVAGVVTEQYDEEVAAGLVVSQSPLPEMVIGRGEAVSFVVSLGREPIPAPDLTGMTQAVAERALRFSGLSLGTVTEQYDEQVPLGCVVSQDPGPGTVLYRGDSVAVVLSKGTQFRSVPDVVGMTQADAESALVAAELTAGSVSMDYHQTIPEGCVFEQTPAAGTSVVVGSAVDLAVSLGRKPVQVPDVTGLMQADAESALTAAELVLGEVREVYNLERPLGEVLDQRPPAGSDAFAGDPVDLDVASDKIVIYTIEELQRIGNDPAYPMNGPYAIGRDIDASETAQWNAGMGFIPIGWRTSEYDSVPFRGSLDGRGHTISGLVINGAQYASLFFFVLYNATISNLCLHGVSFSGTIAAGPIAGYNNGTISDCTIEGTLRAEWDAAGGIAAVNYYNGVIRDCAFEGEIRGDMYDCGGISGYSEWGSITNCRFSGDLHARGHAGGIVGEIEYGFVTDSTAEGTVDGGYASGGIVGFNEGTVGFCQSKCTVIGGNDGVGGVAGVNWGDLYSSGNLGPVYVSGGQSYAGGLVGYNRGSVESCGNVGPVFGGYWATGGLLGRNEGSAHDTFSTGYVSGVQRCGGLVGDNAGDLQRGYALGRVKSADGAGGLVAENSGEVNACFWCIEMTGQTESDGGTGLTIEQLLDPDTFIDAGWDYAGADGWPEWSQIEGQTVPWLTGSEDPGTTYPLEVSAVNGTVRPVPAEELYPAWTLVRLEVESAEPGHMLAGWIFVDPPQGEISAEDVLYLVMHSPLSVEALFLPRPIEISTIEDLQRIGEDPLYPLYWDYVLTDEINASETVSWNGGAGFRPIGDRYRDFQGSLDAQGHGISGLFINRPDEQQVGLFRIVGAEGVVSNLALVDASVTGKWAGTVAGANLGAITDCSVSGMVTGERLGGLVHANGYEETDYFGGGFGSITRCRSSVTVIGYPYTSSFIGGFCGGNAGNISECLSTGTVYGVEFVGGFAGFCSWNGLIASCYASGDVTGYSSVGGFVGAGFAGWVNGCYSVGAVNGVDGVGGFAGYVTGEYGQYFYLTVTSCYWDWVASGTTHSNGGTPKTTAQMMTAATFQGWDFTEIWGIDEGNSYPYLLWEADAAEK